MNCRNCGAAMQAVGGRAYYRCQYCTTFDFPVTAEDGVATLSETTEFNCPICHHALSAATLEGHAINYCGTCRGILTTNALFSQIAAIRRSKQHAPAPPTTPVTKADLQRRLSCAKCKRRMDTHPYGGGGAVVIDTCSRCHLIWLDAGEMDAIAQARAQNSSVPRKQPFLISTAGSCREPESPWRWGGDAYDNPPDNAAGGQNLWSILARLF